MTTELATPVITKARGTALMLASSVFFASSGPIAKPAMAAGLTPLQVAAARIGLAAVILLIGVAVLKPQLLRVTKADWPLLIGFGLLGVAGVQSLYFLAVSRLPVGVAMLLEYLSPVLVALWVRFVRRTMLPRRMWIGTAVALLGLALVAEVWQGIRLDTLGMIGGIGAALCSASYFLLGEHGITSKHPLTVTTWGMIVGGVALFVVAPPWNLPGEVLRTTVAFGPWQPPVWALLVAVALFSTAMAYTIGMMALRHLPSNVASVLSLAEAVIASIAAWALLGETLTFIQIIGGATLLTGAFVVQLASSAKPTFDGTGYPVP